MRYTKKDFDTEFPDDDACLDRMFKDRYGDIECCPSCGVIDAKFYRVKGRKCYACEWCAYQLHPLAQTIFHKSSTPLRSWFYAIFLFSVSKNGVAAKELERHLGVTYKTAHRMCKQIRSLMAEDSPIGGAGKSVEIDETYMGGRIKSQRLKMANKSVIFGAVERDGRVRAKHIRSSGSRVLLPEVRRTVTQDSKLYSDELPAYRVLRKSYSHSRVNHGQKEWARGKAHTNTIEGFWSQMKRSINGTYHAVSPKYLQLYVDEFAFRYSYRGEAVYPVLLERASRRV